MRSAEPSQFTPIKKGKKLIGYDHISKRYQIDRVTEKGRKVPYFRARRFDITASYFPRRKILSEAMIDVQTALEQEREDNTPRGRVMKRVRDLSLGNEALAAMEEFLDYVDGKFRDMKDEVDDRIENLRISVR